MAGKNAGFNADDFRKGIRFVMAMGAPPATEEQALFIKESQLVYNLPGGAEAYVDQEGVPFDPTTTVTRTQPPPVKVLCAVEYFDANGIPTNFGEITPSRAEIVLLDEEYKRVKSCIAVILKGERFVYKSTEFPAGLFDVGVYTMHFTAEDES